MRDNVKKFHDHMLENMIPQDVNQESAGYSKDRYTADDWTIEICQGIIFGEYNSNAIKSGIDYKKSQLEILKTIKDDADILCIGEVGRGLDIIVCNEVKKWKEIICYDHNDVYDKYLGKYFEDLTFYSMPTELFTRDINNYIKDKCIMVLNHTKFRDFDRMKGSNIVHLIFNGEMLW